MAFLFDQNNSLRSAYERVDADGTVWIKARAHGALTAKTPYLVYVGYDGPRTLAIFDTGVATTTAASHAFRYKVGVPDAAVSSDTDGWLQVGGYCGSVTTASVTITQGVLFLWSDAGVGAGTAATATQMGIVNGFGVGYTSASATTSHNMYLLNRHCYGLT